MHEAIVLGALENLERLLGCDVVGAVGLNRVVGHVTNLDAPVIRVIRAALAELGARVATGADASRDVALVLLEPVRDALELDGLVLEVDGLLDGDHVHANAVAARRDHLGDTRKRNESHALEEVGDRGVLVDAVLARVEELGGAGDKVGQAPALDAGCVGDGPIVVVVVAVVILDDADDAHLVEKLLQVRGLDLWRKGHHLVEVIELAELHAVGKVDHLVREDLLETPVLRVVGLDATNLVLHDIRDLAPELGHGGIALGFVLIDRARLFKLFRHLLRPPEVDLLANPIGELVHALARLGRYLDELAGGVALPQVAHKGVEVKVKVRQNINLVEKDDVGLLEHEGILEGLVVALGNREDDGILGGAGVKLGGAHEVANVLKEYQVKSRGVERIDARARHAGVQVAHAARVKLYCACSRLGDDVVGVNGAVDIGLHNANAIGVLKKIDKTSERGCLARARRAHDVEEKLPARLEVFSHAVCLGVIVGKDALF